MGFKVVFRIFQEGLTQNSFNASFNIFYDIFGD
jgi:hypothetical protein